MRSTVHAVHLALGLIVWSLWFVLVYASLSVVCSIAPPATEVGALNWLNAWLMLVTCLVTAVLGVAAWRCCKLTPGKEAGHPMERFTAQVSAAMYLLSAGATLAVGLPALVLPPCL